MPPQVDWPVPDFASLHPGYGSDLPVGQKPVQPSLQKYSDFPNTQITAMFRPSRSTEGRFAVVTNAGWDAVDTEALLTNGANADGKVVWS
jgi:hypothetical protein